MQSGASFPVIERGAPGQGLLLLGVAAIIAGLAVCNAMVGPTLASALLVASLGVLLIAMRPEYGVAVLLSSFLVTYPSFLQGSGVLSLNNGLGLFLGVLLVYRLYRDGDWFFIKSPEVQLLIVIGVFFFVSRYLHTPDRITMALVGDLDRDQDPARVFIGRFAFLLFFISFVRTRRQVMLLFLLAAGLMVMTGVSGILKVLSGQGFEGYRARSGFFIASAGNPNRMAFVAVVAIGTLWYYLQRRKPPMLVQALLWPLIPILVLSIFMTGSRSGVAGLGFATLVMFLEGGFSLRKVLGAVLIVLAGAVLVVQTAPEKSVERISHMPGLEGASDDQLGGHSIERRSYTAGMAIEVATQNPILGVGIGNWEIIRYLEDPAHSTTPPHSSFLLALVEGGVVTLGVYFLLLGRTAMNFFFIERSFRDGPRHLRDLYWVGSSLRLGWLVLLVFSLVGDLWLHIIFYWFIGLGVILRRLVESEGSVPAGATA